MKLNELKMLFLEADRDDDDASGELPPLGNFDLEDKFKPDSEVDMASDAGAANSNADEDKSKDDEDAKETDDENDKDDSDDEEESLSVEDKEIRGNRDKLIDKFNDTNSDSTYIKLVAYEEDEKCKHCSFKVAMTVDPEEIYLDRSKYNDGEAKLELNKIFYKDIESMVKELGIDGIKWTSKGDEMIGIIGAKDEPEDDEDEESEVEDEGVDADEDKEMTDTPDEDDESDGSEKDDDGEDDEDEKEKVPVKGLKLRK